MIYTDHGMSDKIVARVAETPIGPWSKPMTIYHCPDGTGDKRIFCYAAKAHASESPVDELLISYVANSFEFSQVVNDARFYWPKFVRMRWEAK